jgi:hypothetical protein
VGFSFSASYIALWAVVVFQGLLVLALLRQVSQISKLVENGDLPGENPLPVGAPAPRIVGIGANSGRQVDSQQFVGRGGMVLFVSGDCFVCKGLSRSIQTLGHEGLPPMIVCCVGRANACQRFVERIGRLAPVLAGADQIAMRYHVSGFPTVVVIDEQHSIRSYGHPKNLRELTQIYSRGFGEYTDGSSQEESLSLAPANSRT